MLKQEETKESRGSLSFHRRYQKRLASSPEERPLLVYMGVMMGSTKALGLESCAARVFDFSDQSVVLLSFL